MSFAFYQWSGLSFDQICSRLLEIEMDLVANLTPLQEKRYASSLGNLARYFYKQATPEYLHLLEAYEEETFTPWLSRYFESEND